MNAKGNKLSVLFNKFKIFKLVSFLAPSGAQGVTMSDFSYSLSLIKSDLGLGTLACQFSKLIQGMALTHPPLNEYTP